MNCKEIPIVTLSSDDDEKKEEEKTPDPASAIRLTRQSARKRSGRVLVPKKSRNSESDEADESSGDDKARHHKFPPSNRKDRKAKRSSDEEYTPSYENVPRNCDKDVPALPERLVDLNSKRQMFCPVCKAIFKKMTDFILHRRRHVAPDHFMCTTCQKGFVKLADCLEHEFELHHNQKLQDKSGKNSNQTKTKVIATQQKEIIPSTCLYAYRGPPIRNMYEPYEIDYEYTRPQKKLNTRLNSKHILDKHLTIQEETEAIIEAVQSQDSQESQSQGSDLSGKVKQSSVASRSTSNRLNKEGLTSPKRTDSKIVGPRPGNSEGKFKCKKCGHTTGKRRNIEAHIDDKHPAIPDDKIDDYITFVSKTEGLSIEPSGSGAKAKTASTSSGVIVRESGKVSESIVLSFSNISQNVLSTSNRPKEHVVKTKKKESKKKKVTFSKRLDAIRVWEKTKEPLAKSEFLSALSLISNSDVLLGPRQGLQRIESSLFCFRRVHREKSPPPHAKIVLQKLPAEHSTHNHVHLCNICDFIAVTATEIRNHRRNEHFKNNDATSVATEGSERRGGGAGSNPNQNSVSGRSDRLADPPSTTSTAETVAPCVSLLDDIPDDNTEQTLYQCGRCQFESYSKNEVKTHRRVVHKRGESDSSSSSIAPVEHIKVPAENADATVLAPAHPTASGENSVLYQCDMCEYASLDRSSVKKHRKSTHKKKNDGSSSNPSRPPNTLPAEQRLNNFAKPAEPPKKKLKPN